MRALPITEVPVLKPIMHGGDMSQNQRRFPDAPQPWIDLSTGINPVPYPIVALPADAWSRLPTHGDEQALLAAAAARYRIRDAATIVAAPGTQALIQLLPRLLPKSRVAVLGPTYEEHEVCWERQGHEVTVVSTLEETGRADIAVVVNPNNPTGRLLSPETLRALASSVSLLVVDEAFIDLLSPETSLASGVPARTIVLRSFGKTYGLAGLRLGFAIAGPGLIDRIRDELGPWAVSGPALEIGRTALCDGRWLAATTTRLAADQQRLDGILMAAGFKIVGGTSLFRLAHHPEARAMAVKLGQRGIHVRGFSKQPEWIRFGVPGNSEAFERLSKVLSSS
jgi:cobalamin biosynthetic protein CobC